MVVLKLPCNIKYFKKYKKNFDASFANLIIENNNVFITDGGYSMIKLPNNGYEIIEGQFKDNSRYLMQEYIADDKKDTDYCIIKFTKIGDAPVCEKLLQIALNNAEKKGELYRISTKKKTDTWELPARLAYLILKTQVPVAYNLFETFFTLLSDIS